MGYYSEVALWLNAEAVKEAPKAVMEFLEKSEMFKNEDGSVLYHIADVKWYDSFEEINAIEDFMDDMDYGYDDKRYEFLRIGEDEDDNEHRGNTEYSSMWVERSIDFGDRKTYQKGE